MKKKLRKKHISKKSANLLIKMFSFLGAAVLLVGLGFFVKNKLQPGFSAKEKGQIEEATTMVMEQYHIPGIIVGIWVPGKGTYIKGFGYSDKEAKLVMDPALSFRIGSLTKTFTATILLQLQDEGKINLDDTLETYLPDVPNAANMTLRQLATMTAGLYNYTDDEAFIREQAQNPNRQWTPQELVNFALRHPPYFAPGQGYHYSNTNYVLLGMVIEKVTGHDMATELQQRITTPLGLTHTFYATNSAMPANSSHGYSVDKDGTSFVDATDYNPSVSAAAGEIVSNTNDLQKWAQELGKGTLVSKKAQAERLAWVDEPNTQTSKYGLGVMKIGNFIGHEGSIYGYNSIIAYLPSKDAVFVIMQNTYPSQASGIAGNLFAILAKITMPNDVSW